MDEAQGAVAASEIVLRPDKQMVFLRLALCLGFVIGSKMMIDRHYAPVIGWIGIVFFGFGVLVFLTQLLFDPSWLYIRSDGFSYCNLFRKSPLILSRDVSDFRIARVPPSGNRMVVFDWNAAPSSGVRRFNTGAVGATDALPETYGMGPEELAALLNDWRLRAISGV